MTLLVKQNVQIVVIKISMITVDERIQSTSNNTADQTIMVHIIPYLAEKHIHPVQRKVEYSLDRAQNPDTNQYY